jgi:trans-aconitate methyltransferase
MAFDFDGKKYAQASAHQKEWGARLIAELDLDGTEHILDLGCGDGGLTSQLAALVPQGRVVGVDASPGMIDVAGTRATGNLSFCLMDINHWTLADRFDLIFSNATLHWILDHGVLLANVYDHLTDTGVARFNFAGEGNCSCLCRVVNEVMQQNKYEPYYQDFVWPWFMPSVEQYEALLQHVPFRETRVWGENTDRNFPGADALIGWIDQPSLVPFLRQVEGPVKKDFRDAVVERMLRETDRGDGTYFETFRRINVLAKR